MHETGHLLGLPDRYEDINTAGTGNLATVSVHPGFENDLMGSASSENLDNLYYSQYLEKANSDEANTMRCYLQIGVDLKGNVITPYEKGGIHVDSPYKKND